MIKFVTEKVTSMIIVVAGVAAVWAWAGLVEPTSLGLGTVSMCWLVVASMIIAAFIFIQLCRIAVSSQFTWIKTFQWLLWKMWQVKNLEVVLNLLLWMWYSPEDTILELKVVFFKAYLWFYHPFLFGSGWAIPHVFASRKHCNLVLGVVERHKTSYVIQSLANWFVSVLVQDIPSLQDSWDTRWSFLKKKLCTVWHRLHHFSHCGNDG